MQGQVRVGVAAPTPLVHAALVAADPSLDVHALDLAGPGAPRLLDVVVLGDGWAGGAGGPDDLWAAASAVRRRTRAPIVLLAPSGADVPEEVAVVVPPTTSMPEVVATVVGVATDPTDVASQPAPGGIWDLLEGSTLLAGVARAVVVEGATSWGEVARLAGFSVRTVESVPGRIADRVRADLDLGPSHDVTQAVVYFWLGTKREVVRAWLRRQDRDRWGRQAVP